MDLYDKEADLKRKIDSILRRLENERLNFELAREGNLKTGRRCHCEFCERGVKGGKDFETR